MTDLIAGGGNIAASALTNPNVDGISIRVQWSQVETADGVFDWRYLDSTILQAEQAGKFVTLRVGTPAQLTPAWLVNKIKANGGQFFSYLDDAHGNGVVSLPVLWDATLADAKRHLLIALGQKYGNRPSIKVVYVCFAGVASTDWGIPASNTLRAEEQQAGFTTTEVQRWQAAGYTTQKLIDAGCPATATTGVIDAAISAFPASVVVFSSNTNPTSLDPNGKRYAASTVFQNAQAKYGTHVATQKDDLSQKTSVNQPFSGQPADNGWRLIYDARPQVAAQMVWTTNDMARFAVSGYTGTQAQALTAAVDCGKNYGTSYQEIYQGDITNTSADMKSAIAHAHTVLTQ